MRKIILTWLALCAALFGAWQLSAIDIPNFKSAHIERLLVSPAHAQLSLTGAGRGAPSSGGGLTWTSTDAEYTICGYSGTTCTVSLSINPGLLIVAAGGQGLNSGDMTGMSICSTSLTQGATTGLISTSLQAAELWYGVVTCSGSQTLTATAAGANWYELDAAVGTLTGYTSTTPTSTCINSSGSSGTSLACSSALTVPSSGIAIGVGYQRSSPISWTNMPGGNNSLVSSDGTALTNGSNTTAGSLTPNLTVQQFSTTGIAANTWH